MREIKTSYEMQAQLHREDKWAWSILVALKFAPDQEKRKALWAMLDLEQQARLQEISKVRNNEQESKD